MAGPSMSSVEIIKVHKINVNEVKCLFSFFLKERKKVVLSEINKK